jgi:hypothetical protein
MSEENLDNAQKNQKKVGAASDDPHTTGPAENVREEAAEMNEDDGSRDPMSPENIREHEPTAVQRDEGSNITQEGQAGTNTEEAREKYKKKGMTEV